MTYGPDRQAMIPLMIGAMAAIPGYVAGAVVAFWGVAHAAPSRQVLTGFVPITADNRRILLQEWLAEAFTMWASQRWSSS